MKRQENKDSKIEKLLFIFSKEENIQARKDYINENGDYIYPCDITINEPNNASGCPSVSILSYNNFRK